MPLESIDPVQCERRSGRAFLNIPDAASIESTMKMSPNGRCVHCRGRMRVTPLGGDAVVSCPHCGREMAASAALENRSPYRRWVWAEIAAAVVIGLAILAFVYRAPLGWAFDILAEETGSMTAAIVCLGVALLALLWAALWLLFPIVVFLGLRDLRRRTSEVDATTELCARHLAYLVEKRGRFPERSPEQQPTAPEADVK